MNIPEYHTSLLIHTIPKRNPSQKTPSLPTSDNMKIFAIAATALLVTVAYASPAQVEARSLTVQISFIGAAGVTFSQVFSADNTLEAISNYHLFFCSSPHSYQSVYSDI